MIYWRSTFLINKKFPRLHSINTAFQKNLLEVDSKLKQINEERDKLIEDIEDMKEKFDNINKKREEELKIKEMMIANYEMIILEMTYNLPITDCNLLEIKF